MPRKICWAVSPNQLEESMMIDRRTMIGLLAATIPAAACAKPAKAAELKSTSRLIAVAAAHGSTM